MSEAATLPGALTNGVGTGGEQPAPSSNGSAGPMRSQGEPYPSPALLADWAWIYEQGSKGALSEYQGRHIAVFDRTIVAAGADADVLRRDVSQRFGVHPERIAIFWNDGPGFDVSSPSWE